MNYRFNLPRFYLHIVAILFLLSTKSVQASFNLPSLGDSTSSIVSAQDEYITGQSWLRSFRRQAPISDDPLIYAYFYELINRLALNSPLPDKHFSLVVVNSNSFNAFAVPGNVMGMNLGLFRYAETQDELASVIAHEIAHLSQRHYARSVDQEQKQSIPLMAALLGSLLILANGNAEGGIAALTATQAVAISNQLKYSRSQESEADRIGIQTLANAGMNPDAIAHMFQHMSETTRYRSDLKELDFLLTHPMSTNRVSDALNQSRLYPKRNYEDSLAFHVIKARAFFLSNKNYSESAIIFRSQISNAKYPLASQYGLALSLIAQNKLTEAEPIVDEINKFSSSQLAFVLLKIDLLTKQNKLDEAMRLLEAQLAISPNNLPLSMKAASVYTKANQLTKAVSTLRLLTLSDQQINPDVWYLAAETEGLAGNIVEVHLARAEYYAGIGAFTQAQRHLYLALPLLENNLQAATRAQLRINEIEQLKQQEQFQ